MNETLKRICPLVAIVCFALCIIGALGIIKTATTTEWKLVGVFFTGVAIFVPFVLFGISALCSCSNPSEGKKYPAKGNYKNNPRPPRPSRNVNPNQSPNVKPKSENESTNENTSGKNETGELKRDNGKQLPEETAPTTLYICNLAAEINEADLKEEFGVFGEVKSVKLISDKDGQHRGYAFVEMANKAEAELAIEDINAQQLKGQEVKVSYARRKGTKRRRS